MCVFLCDLIENLKYRRIRNKMMRLTPNVVSFLFFITCHCVLLFCFVLVKHSHHTICRWWSNGTESRIVDNGIGGHG